MSMHTPGPWNLGCDGVIWAIYDGGPQPLAKCEDLDADAQLMTAAPELLAACKAVLRRGFVYANADGSRSKEELMVRAAIEQAEAAP